MEMKEFNSLRDAINERTLMAAKKNHTAWRAITVEDLVATLEELQEREMLVKE